MTREKLLGLRRESEKSPEYFYSERLGKYVSAGFLKVDEKVVAAANELNLNLEWDDEGRVCNIGYLEARALLDALGSQILSPSEYWRLHREVEEKGDLALKAVLESDSATEWLDVIFEKDTAGNIRMIEHPEIYFSKGKLNFRGDTKKINQPEARPGWFHPKENIDKKTGMPINVETKREKGTPSWSQTTWKYWSTFKKEQYVAGIRGYVTSSGTPSFDLDIPIGAKLPVLMIRECRDKLPAPKLSADLLLNSKNLIEKYLKTNVDVPGVNNFQEHHDFYNQSKDAIEFVRTYGLELFTNKAKKAREIQEKTIDILGTLYLEANQRNDSSLLRDIKEVTSQTFSKTSEFGSYEKLAEFLATSRERLQKAIRANKSIVFAMGHKNPDTDTVISSLFEAYRNSALDKDTCYVPVIQDSRIPDEIKQLLGPEFSQFFILESEDLYQKAKGLGQTRWILVDHNKSEQQKFATAIVDHHILSSVARRQDVVKTWEMIGSCSAQVIQKMLGVGIVPDGQIAKLLHGATLMDTENRGPKKMTYKDRLIMDYLKNISGISDENDFYQELMGHLLNTGDAKRLFERDYKEDWGIFGFAVAKVKNVLSKEGEVLKPHLLSGLIAEAAANNKRNNFCMTIIKLVDYEEDNESVNRERIYLIFNDYASKEFREAIFNTFENIVKYEFHKTAKMKRIDNGIEFWGVKDQLSRKVTAPKLEPIVSAFNEYYFSNELGLHIKREFLQIDSKVQTAADKLGIDLYADKEGRVFNITYHEAKRLLDELRYGMLSLNEYWKVRNEVGRLNDIQMQKHLHYSGFVEFTDTVLLDYKYMLNHPKLTVSGGVVSYEGEKIETNIPSAFPALIYPDEIDSETGLPVKTHEGQDKYSDERTWRYWSPDAPVVIPTRGHIFLLNKPALDAKIHPDDALPNLGIRVCTKEVKYPNVVFEEVGGELKIKIVK